MAVDFIGASSQWVNLGLNLPVAKNVPAATIMGWVKRNGAAGSNLRFLSVSVGPPPGTSSVTRIALGMTTGAVVRVTAGALDTDTSTAQNGTAVIPDQVWTHVAAVVSYVANVISIYLNGVLDVSVAIATGSTAGNTSNTNAKCAAIAATSTGASAFPTVALEDLRIYGRALGADELKTITASRGKDGIWNGCHLRYMLNEGGPGSAVTQVVDLGSANRAGSPTNSPLYIAGIVSPRQKRAVKYRR